MDQNENKNYNFENDPGQTQPGSAGAENQQGTQDVYGQQGAQGAYGQPDVDITKSISFSVMQYLSKTLSAIPLIFSILLLFAAPLWSIKSVSSTALTFASPPER